MTLEEQVILLIDENKKLREIISNLEKHIQMQDKRISELEDSLRKSKINKHSGNSSKPPSSDIFNRNRNQSLREITGKQSGGQPGHKGTSLQMIDNPDKVIELSPNYCNKCGYSLEKEEVHFRCRRQEVNIPPISATVTEYRLNSKHCPNCGHHQESEFPSHISNNIQYGSNVASLVSYLSVYQYLPFRRLKELFKHIFNLDISEGTIDNILRRMSEKALPVYARIKETISQSSQVGSDETSVKVKGKKWWIWVWQTVNSTYLSTSHSRGMAAIDSIFPDGLGKSILNSDRWAAQLGTKASGHQLCIAHLLRDLNFIAEVDKIDWSKRLKVLLQKGLELKQQESVCSYNNPEAMQLERELEILLKEEIPKNRFKKTQVIQKSLLKHRDSIFKFLYHMDLPPDNNASERAIRNVKVKQKISGQFKTGEQVFCILRSIIDTCKKRNYDVLLAMNSIANF